MLSLAEKAHRKFSLASWWYLTHHTIYFQYLPLVIKHDDVSELEYMIENSPFPIELSSVAKLTLLSQEILIDKKEYNKITAMTRWCLDRHLIRFNSFSLFGRTTISNQPEWQSLAKTYPEFDADDEMCKFREGPDGSYYG
jgi:hypothetical protein